MISDVSQLTSAIDNYAAYRDTGAVESVQTLDSAVELRDSIYSAIQNKEIGKDNEEMLKKLLRQPVMADLYAANGISPKDVPAYIDHVMQQSNIMKRAVLSGFAFAYNEAAKSMHEERNPVVDGNRELRSLKTHITLQDPIMSTMHSFSEQRQPAAPEKVSFGKKVMQWVKEKMPGAKTIAAGFVFAVSAPNLPQMVKLWDKQSDKTETVAKNDKQTKAQDGKTYTPSVKDFNNQGRA